MENGSRPPRRWVPDHAGRAIIACLRDGTVAMELIDWGSPEDAAEADAVLYKETRAPETTSAGISGIRPRTVLSGESRAV